MAPVDCHTVIRETVILGLEKLLEPVALAQKIVTISTEENS